MAHGRLIDNPTAKFVPDPVGEKLDRCLFIMPEDPEHFFAAVAVLQQFKADVSRRMEEQHFHIVLPNEDLRFLLMFLSELSVVDSRACTIDYDLVFRFDGARAMQLAVATDKHITTAFGIQLGVEPKSIPHIKEGLEFAPPAFDVVILRNVPEKLREDVRIWFEGAYPELKVVRQPAGDISVEGDASFALLGSTVVGVRSLGTYAACALGRNVVEIYPNIYHRRWLSKWSHRQYAMISCTPDMQTVTVDLVRRGVEGLWQQKMKAHS